LVDVVVFVPMSLSGGMIGNILREFSLVVVFSTLMSLLVSFTLTPLLASRFAKLEHLTQETLRGRFFLAFESMLDRIKEAYGRALRVALRNKKWVLVSILAMLIGAFALVPAGFIGTAFVSPSDKGELNIALEMAPETPVAQMNRATLQAEQILLSKPIVVKVFANVGTQSGNSLTGNTSNSNLSELAVTLLPKEERSISTEKFGIQIREELSAIPGLKVTIKPTSITGTSEAPVQVAVRGTNMDSIWVAAATVKDIVKKTAGTDYVEYSTKLPKNEISIELDRDKIAMVGLTVPEIGNAVQLAFRGNDNAKFTDRGEEYNINITADQFDKKDIESVRNLTVRTAKGSNVRLADVATIKQKLGQSVLERTNRLNSIKVTAFTAGRPNGTIIADIQQEIAKVRMPEGVIIDYVGEAERQKDAFGSLGIAMMIGFLLVYLIMVALYESAVYPFVVMFSIPVALIGALLALALTMEVLSIFAIVGLIMLMGLVAKNGILIVDFANHLKASGMELTEALVEAGKERLRPILMTTVAMILGMLPIAISTGSGAEVKNGMAWVIIGGLTSSLFLTLFLVPTMYYVVDAVKDRAGRLFKKV
ncbi:MAG TPA: efflux RND transporter permease subunit, partial [Chitinophagales bacterium]|nr:efflux RND transporter permease subunit [Chitinophagales bacterium]